ncbi:MAG: hypothetical protein H8E15_05355 [Planctomycetes bacterium]|nr:hypothetical protein [Planctomycetota bacterium]
MLSAILLACASSLIPSVAAPAFSAPSAPSASIAPCALDIAAQEVQGPNALEVLEQARLDAQQSGRNLFVYLEAPW